MRPPRREPFPPADDLDPRKQSGLDEAPYMPEWAMTLHRGHIRLSLRQQAMAAQVKAMRAELREYRNENKQKLKAKGKALEVAKSIPLILGVLSLMFPHLKPLIEAILKGLGTP